MPLWLASILLLVGMLLFISIGLKLGVVLCGVGLMCVIAYELFTLPKA